MNRWTVAVRSAAFYRGSSAATVFGAAVGTAAIIGSLIVGDSVRLSLRDSALGRVGRVEFAIRSESFFPEDLARRTMGRAEFREEFGACEPVVLLRGSARLPKVGGTESPGVKGASPAAAGTAPGARDNGAGTVSVSVVGVGGGFFQRMFGEEPPRLGDGCAAVNAPLAEDLGLSEGDEILVSIGRRGRGPVHTIFADRHRDDAVGTLRLSVAKVLPPKGSGAFSLHSDTMRVRNAFVSISWLQKAISRRGMANCLLVSARGDASHVWGGKARNGGSSGSGGNPGVHASTERRLARILASAAEPSDYGLDVSRCDREGEESMRAVHAGEMSRPSPPAGGTLRGTIHAREILLPAAAARAAMDAAASHGMAASFVSAYLANSISLVRNESASETAAASASNGETPGGGQAPDAGEGGGTPNGVKAGAGERRKRASVPYSVVAGVDSAPGEIAAGSAGPLGDSDIVLNEWTAESLGARVGDIVEIAHYSAGLNGTLSERARRFAVKGVAAMRGDAIRRDLVPRIEGLTNAAAVNDWKVPFPLDMSRIRPEDEAYWEEYRTAPKAYVSLRVAADMWRPYGYSIFDPDAGAKADAGAYLDWLTTVVLRPVETATARFGRAGAAGGEGGSAAPAGGGRPGADWDKTWDAFLEDFRARLDPEAMGLSIRAVRAEAMAAAEGSADFGSLFLAMSSLLILAACMLIGLTFRLSAERRAGQAGIILATGHSRASVAGILWRECAILAACGATAGIPCGIVYGWLLIKGLGGVWSSAAGGEALSPRVGLGPVAIGGAAGLAISLAAMWWGMRVLKATSVARLLGGWKAMAAQNAGGDEGRRRRAAAYGWVGLGAAAAGLGLVAASSIAGIPAEAAFFCAGAMLLAGALALARALLERLRSGPVAGRAPRLSAIAVRSAAMNPVRSVAAIGLMACASFVLAVISANWNGRGEEELFRRDSGTGGFALVATTGIPVPADIGSESGRKSLGIGAEAEGAGTAREGKGEAKANGADGAKDGEAAAVGAADGKGRGGKDIGGGAGMSGADGSISHAGAAGETGGSRGTEGTDGRGGSAGGTRLDALSRVAIYSCRMSDGDEAGCLNARRPIVPRIIGAPASLIARGGFAFAEAAAPPIGNGGSQDGSGRASESSAAPANPWKLLELRLPDGAIPAFADADSAMWILKKQLGDEIHAPGARGKVKLRLVGLLSRSIFAGALVVSEARFVEALGDGGGYRYFLVETPGREGEGLRGSIGSPAAEEIAAAGAAMRSALERFGAEVVRTPDVLAAYASVRDAYLSAFGTLGGLALLLGALGTAAVTLRSVSDLRGELAMMLAMGFPRRRLIASVVLQNVLPPLLGAAVGMAASVVAAVPHIARGISGLAWSPAALTIAAAAAAAAAVCLVAARIAIGGDLIGALRSE